MKNAMLRTHAWIITRTGGPAASDRGGGDGIPGLVILVGGIVVALAIVVVMKAVGTDLGKGIQDAVK